MSVYFVLSPLTEIQNLTVTLHTSLTVMGNNKVLLQTNKFPQSIIPVCLTSHMDALFMKVSNVL